MIPLCLVLAAACSAPPSYSFMMWDWTPSCQDFSVFKQRVEQAKSTGFDTIDLTASWKSLEKSEGTFEFSAIDSRVDYCRKLGLKVRLRVNVSYAHAWPDWYPAVLMTARDGSAPTEVLSPFSPKAAEHWARVGAAVSAHFKDRVQCYMPGFGMHMEVKYGAYISYEPPAVRSFRVWLSSRYGAIAGLNAAWKTSYKSFDEIQPPIPVDGRLEPDLSQSLIDFIKFREDQLAYVTDTFIEGIKRGYPGAVVAVQLGESYRRESAQMANLAYCRYSRLADEVVHSYDFFLHPHDEPRHALESVATFIGTTRKKVIVEFDGPILYNKTFRYTDADLSAIGKACLDSGASGLHVSNYCDVDPRGIGFIKQLAKMTGKREVVTEAPDSLFYISKWTIYLLPMPGEKLHERIYSYYRHLCAKGEKPRIISDENLIGEDLSRYKKIFVSYSPIMDKAAYEALTSLGSKMPVESDTQVGTSRIEVR